MAQYSATEIVLILGAFSGMAVAIITAWRTGNRVEVANKKMDEVHKVTNDNFSLQREEIKQLRAQLQSARTDAASAETVRAVLASEAVRALLPAEVARTMATMRAAELATQHALDTVVAKQTDGTGPDSAAKITTTP